MASNYDSQVETLGKVIKEQKSASSQTKQSTVKTGKIQRQKKELTKKTTQKQVKKHQQMKMEIQ
ncbi:MAG: hypothetical protein ACLVI9_05065 [Anaerostipes hadrus]